MDMGVADFQSMFRNGCGSANPNVVSKGGVFDTMVHHCPLVYVLVIPQPTGTPVTL